MTDAITARGRFIGLLLIVVVAPVGMAFLHYFFNERLFVTDDAQSMFYPALHEISRIMNSGDLPWLTLRSWNFGHLAAEYILGIFNPVSMFITFWIGQLDNLGVAALLFVASHTAIAALGIYFLARNLGASPLYAGLAAFAATTDNYVVYWYAAVWVPGLVAFAWVPWAVLFVFKAYDDARFILPAALALYMVIASGYPPGPIALAVVIGVSLAAFLSFDRTLRPLIRVATAGACGVLLSAPALLPPIVQFSHSLRVQWGPEENLNSFLSASLSGLVNFAFPSYLPVTASWGDMFGGKYGVIDIPFYYAGWFLLIPLVYFDWHGASHEGRRILMALAITVVALALVCMLPTIMPFRWFFKYIPYYHLILILAGCLVLSHDGLLKFSIRRKRILMGAFVALAIVSAELSPRYLGIHLVFLCLVLAGAYFFDRLHGLGRFYSFSFVFAVTLIIAIASAVIWRVNPEPSHGAPPLRVSEQVFLGSKGENLAVLALSDFYCCDTDVMGDLPFGNLVFLSSNSFVNGYSGLRSKGLADTFCMQRPWGTVCPELSEWLFAPKDDLTGLSLADLMRLDLIVVKKGRYLDEFLRYKTDEWVLSDEGVSAGLYRRAAPLDELPGRVAWLPAGISLTALDVGLRTETYAVKIGNSYKGAPILFERPWLPAYEAYFDDRRLDVQAYRGVIVGVKLPRSTETQGTLTLRYRLPGAPWSVVVAGLGLVAAALATLLFRSLGGTWLHRNVEGSTLTMSRGK